MSQLIIERFENESDIEFAVRKEAAIKLSNDWQSCNRSQERFLWRIEDGDFKDIEGEDQEAFQRETEEIMSRMMAHKKVIEMQLKGMGARMGRPYEHWNEQEREIEYLENRNND
jgi:hypothetical protein